MAQAAKAYALKKGRWFAQTLFWYTHGRPYGHLRTAVLYRHLEEAKSEALDDEHVVELKIVEVKEVRRS